MTFLDNPSAAAILDVERFATAVLPLATTPLTLNELMTLLQNGRNVYISVQDFIAAIIAQLGLVGWTYQNSNFVAASGDKVLVDTSGAPVTVTLPAPGLGHTLELVDALGTFEANNLTVLRNGGTIMGLPEDMIVDIDRAHLQLVGLDSSDWRLAS